MMMMIMIIIVIVIGRLTSWLFSLVEELKLGIAVLEIQLVARVGIEPGILDSKSGILSTWPPCLHYITSLSFNLSILYLSTVSQTLIDSS